MVRAVVAVTMCCDMLPGGISSCGPSNVKHHIDELTEIGPIRAIELAKKLLTTYKKCKFNNHKALPCRTESFLYAKSELYGYINGIESMELNLYLGEDYEKLIKINTSINLSICEGIEIGKSHDFIT